MSEDARRQTGAGRSHIVVVDDDVRDLEVLKEEIAGRYGGAYGVVSGYSARETLTALEATQRNGQRVAVVLARQWMAEMNGSDLLASLRSLHPRAKRYFSSRWRLGPGTNGRCHPRGDRQRL